MLLERWVASAQWDLKVVEGGAGFGKNQQVVLADFEVVANVVGGDCEEQLGEEIFVDVERHDA